VIEESGKDPFLQLTNVAQFMELFFDECDDPGGEESGGDELDEDESDLSVGLKEMR